MAFRLVGHHPTLIPKTIELGRRKQYPNALRKAVSELLAGELRTVEIFRGDQLWAVCGLQRENIRGRGSKYFVRCSGEKPTKAMGERAARAFKAARQRARSNRR